MIFCMGLAYAANIFVGYVLVMELLPESSTAVATSLTLGLDGLVLTWCSLFFMFISKNWKTLYVFPLISTYGAVLMVFMLPESPKHLVNQGNYDHARKVISKMAKENKLKRFNTREDEPYPNPDNLMIYQSLFIEEVSHRVSVKSIN